MSRESPLPYAVAAGLIVALVLGISMFMLRDGRAPQNGGARPVSADGAAGPPPDAQRPPSGGSVDAGGSGAAAAGSGAAGAASGGRTMPEHVRRALAGELTPTGELPGVAIAPQAPQEGTSLAPESPDTPEALARKAKWYERQDARNRLRLNALSSELGAGSAAVAGAAAAYTAALDRRAALFEAVDAGRVDEASVDAGLASIDEELARALRTALGAATYEALQRREDSGAFVLPDEVKKPPR